jgi:glycosyltransferase involved in cell wall biosynthesis
MKICFICPEYPNGPHGGIGSMVQIISRQLVSEGHEVNVIGVYSKTYPAPDYEVDQGVQVWRLRTLNGKFGWIPPYLKQFQMIRKWVENECIEIVEAPDSRGWIAFWPTISVPVILRAHGSNSYFSKVLGTKLNKFTSFLEKKSYKRADGLLSVSQYTAEVTKQVLNLSKDFTIIHNGIEIPDVDDTLLRENNKIVYSGRLNIKKGVIQLIVAFLQLLDKQPDLKIEIYGENTIDLRLGSIQDYLQNLIPDKWRKNVEFKGHISRVELMKVFWTASVAVFPSFAEAFALAPMESMVRNCPTIYTSLGSGNEVIENEVDGLLIDPNNTNEIANAINRVLKNPKFAAKIGRNGREKIIKKFSTKAMVSQSIDFYKKTILNFNHDKETKKS